MSYQVLARKWRPRNFAELVGQEHVVRALSNALADNRLHHAFLFAGTRGVGKTTLARIFAKALNCEQGVNAEPCGRCNACVSVDEGRFIDLIEVDAASRTRVEDTRELLENVQYAPSRGRYKVYLIDEVHMLSQHSFNALLKTLEEPPPHVKFLLATTDPQKLPITVLSRCLQFKLKRLADAMVVAQLEKILHHEGVAGERQALELIARAGEGSLRDALSLLDQAIAFGGGRLTAGEVADMLGLIEARYAIRLLQALAENDVKRLLDCVAELDRDAPDYAAVLAELLSWLQRIALAQALPDAPPDDERYDPQALAALSRALSPEDVQLYYQIALIGRRDLPLMPEPRSGFEMVLLRMLCFSRDKSPAQTAPAPPNKAAPAAGATAHQAGESGLDWPDLLERLPLSGMARQLALHCSLAAWDGDGLTLALDPSHAKVRTDKTEQRLKAALEAHFDRPLVLKIVLEQSALATPAQIQTEQQQARQQIAVATIQQDPNVQAMQEKFNARLNIDSVRATD